MTIDTFDVFRKRRRNYPNRFDNLLVYEKGMEQMISHLESAYRRIYFRQVTLCNARSLFLLNAKSHLKNIPTIG